MWVSLNTKMQNIHTRSYSLTGEIHGMELYVYTIFHTDEIVWKLGLTQKIPIPWKFSRCCLSQSTTGQSIHVHMLLLSLEYNNLSLHKVRTVLLAAWKLSAKVRTELPLSLVNITLCISIWNSPYAFPMMKSDFGQRINNELSEKKNYFLTEYKPPPTA